MIHIYIEEDGVGRIGIGEFEADVKSKIAEIPEDLYAIVAHRYRQASEAEVAAAGAPAKAAPKKPDEPKSEPTAAVAPGGE